MFQSSHSNRRNRPAGQTLMARLKADATDSRRPWWIRALIRTGLLAVFVVALGVGGWWIRDRWVYQIPSLAIREIVVEVDGVLAPDEVRRLAGIRLGRNILSVDLPRLRDRLQLHPRVASARIVVEFPGTLSIQIRERLPVAAVEPLAGSGIKARYLLDETGHVIMPLSAGSAPETAVAAEAALPRITGRGTVSPEVDADTLAALRFLREHSQRPEGALPDIASVSVAIPGLLDVTTLDGATIRFGGEPASFDLQLRRWSDLRAALAASGEKRVIWTLDLSVSQNAPIRWLESSSPEQPATTPASPQNRPRLKRIPRRTHV
jgi:cell division septal protein FtsQ